MIRNFGRRASLHKWASLLLLLPLLSACTNGGKPAEKSSVVIDPPPQSLEQQMLNGDGPSVPTMLQPAVIQDVPEHVVTVYLRDERGYLAPMTLQLGEEKSSQTESVQATAETAMDWMIEKPNQESELPGGFSAVLPAETQTKSIKVDSESGVATIDFASPMPNLPAWQERQLLEALVWTMTELNGIDQVKLTVDGEPIRSLPASGMPAPEVLTRGIGINVELAEGVAVSRSMGVTLYFSARNSQGDDYFVPVTRLIERQDNRLRAAMDELIKGPVDSSGLQPVFLTGISVDRLLPTAGSVNISLLDEGWSPSSTIPSSMMQAIVLTMTEAADVPSVKVSMNGEQSFQDSDERSYELPVNRPVVINMLNP